MVTTLEPRLTPSSPWSAGWPESLRVYGHGIDDDAQVRVWVEDPAIAVMDGVIVDLPRVGF